MNYETYEQVDKISEKREAKLLSLIEENRISEIKAFLKDSEDLRLVQWQIRTIISNFNSNFRDDKVNLKDLKQLRNYGLRRAKVKDDILRLKYLGVKSSAYPINRLFVNQDEFLDFDKRQGQCHVLCYRIAKGLQEDECSVLTGFAYGMTSQTKYLHSVIRIKVGKHSRIIDTTMNAMVVEEFYKKLTNFEVLTEVPSSQIKEDSKILSTHSVFNLKKYFLHRDRYMKEMCQNEKNCNELLNQELDEMLENNTKRVNNLNESKSK